MSLISIYKNPTHLQLLLCSVDKTNEVRRLGMGRLLSELAQKMESKAVNGDGVFTKILVHSTHDVGLAAICSTLDVFDEKYVKLAESHTTCLRIGYPSCIDGRLSQLLLLLNCLVKSNMKKVIHTCRTSSVVYPP